MMTVEQFTKTPEGLESELVVVNDTASELTADLSWQAGDDEGATELTVDGRDRWTGGPIDLPAEAEVRLELSAADYTVENRYVR
jgi:hypothetical protein